MKANSGVARESRRDLDRGQAGKKEESEIRGEEKEEDRMRRAGRGFISNSMLH